MNVIGLLLLSGIFLTLMYGVEVVNNRLKEIVSALRARNKEMNNNE